jgi:PAP2 superfamily
MHACSQRSTRRSPTAGSRPLANTANDPSYPGAHAEFSQAAATVLENFFGTDAFSFSLSNPSVNITRSFRSFSQAANEASESRIFAGQHFQHDQNAGQAQGSQVAAFVLANAFQALGDRGRDRNDG